MENSHVYDTADNPAYNVSYQKPAVSIKDIIGTSKEIKKVKNSHRCCCFEVLVTMSISVLFVAVVSLAIAVAVAFINMQSQVQKLESNIEQVNVSLSEVQTVQKNMEVIAQGSISYITVT